MVKLSNFTRGFLSGIGAVLCFSVITTFGVLVYKQGVSPLSLLTFRSVIACILMFLTVLLSKGLSFRIEKKDWFRVFMNSLLLGIFLIFFWYGTREIVHIPTVYACYFTYPFWTAIMAGIFLKEKFTKLRWLSLLLGTVGTLFAIGFLPAFSVGSINLYGVGLVLLCAVIWGIDVLIGQQLFKKYKVIPILFYNFLISSVLFMLLQNPMMVVSQMNHTALFYMSIITLVSTYFAFILFSNAIKNFGGANWGITNLSSPIFNSAAAFVFLGQVVGGYQALGILLSTVGVYLLYRGKGK